MKTKSRSKTKTMPTVRGVANYLAAKLPGVSRVRSSSIPAVGGLSPRSAAPELVLALDRADEFPRLIEQYDAGDSRDRNTWEFEVRLDMAAGQTLYRCWSVSAGNYEQARQRLCERCSRVRIVTVYAVRRPPTLEEIDQVSGYNARIQRVRDRCGPWVTLDDLAKRVAQLEF